MSGAGFILAINLFVTGFLAASFLMVAAWDRMRVAARWLAFSYVLGMAYFGVEATIPLFDNARTVVVVAFSIFLLATMAFNAGVGSKYGVSIPWLPMAGIFVVSVAAVWVVQDLPRHSFTRMMAYQAPYFVMTAIAAVMVLSSNKRRALDHAFAALLAATALQFLSKPFIAHALGGWGENPQAYLQSNYAMVSQAMGTIFAIGIALMMLVILVRDLLADVTVKSETDTLSGLLNRRGFEQRATQALVHAVEQGMPVSLVIADIDHFKSFNDRFGHAVGDRVIAAFAGYLGQASADPHVAGRIGGEEFAILLPGLNSVAARLFAEGARHACAGLAADVLPADVHFTASFGVAERLGGEALDDLMRRADAALYEAKNGGRDCVRAARTDARVRQVTAT